MTQRETGSNFCLRSRDDDEDADIKYYVKNAPFMLRYVENYAPPAELFTTPASSPHAYSDVPTKHRRGPVTRAQTKKMMEQFARHFGPHPGGPDDPPPPLF
ncbi:hypothetical protein CASFOL_022405 [Castilleja foliolosa]|uniref:Uncharacterized protein n=1 Tax=Castilleja foliolosa TaxID=1961234 RepID=A0ABD3CUH4_9LAMI